MGKASSAKKVARAARVGGRSSSRRRNLVFPGAVAAIVAVGIGLIVVAAGDRRSAADDRPILGDHWHSAYGFYVCDGFQPHLTEFESRAGIHSHGDGVIHIHPFSSSGTGENATMRTFLEDADAELSDDTLRIGEESWTEGDQTCDGEDAELVVAQWDDVQTNEGEPEIVRSDLAGVRFTADGAGYTIAFVPEGTTDIPKPPTAENLAELGAVDEGGGQAPQVPVEGEGSTPTGEGTDGGQPEAPAGGDAGDAGGQPGGDAGGGGTDAPAGGGDATSGG